MRQLGEVAEREDLALLVGDLPEGLAQKIPVEVAPGLGEGLVRPGLGRGSLKLVLSPAAARAGAELVYSRLRTMERIQVRTLPRPTR